MDSGELRFSNQETVVVLITNTQVLMFYIAEISFQFFLEKHTESNWTQRCKVMNITNCTTSKTKTKNMILSFLLQKTMEDVLIDSS